MDKLPALIRAFILFWAAFGTLALGMTAFAIYIMSVSALVLNLLGGFVILGLTATLTAFVVYHMTRVLGFR